MKKGTTLAFLFFLAVGLLPAYAQTEEEGEFVVKSKDGLHFKVPADMPIVERGGVILPLPTDEYLIQKINALTERMDDLRNRTEALDQKVDSLNKQLERLFLHLSQTQKKERQGIQEGGEAE